MRSSLIRIEVPQPIGESTVIGEPAGSAKRMSLISLASPDKSKASTSTESEGSTSSVPQAPTMMAETPPSLYSLQITKSCSSKDVSQYDTQAICKKSLYCCFAVG